MADKRAIKVETLDRLGASFQESRGITDKLTIEQMIELAKVPTASGDNKLAQFVDGTLTEITAEDLEGATVITRRAFYQNERLIGITIPNSVTSIGVEAFRTCLNLKNVTFGNGVTTIVDSAFQGCTSLTSINIPNNVTSIAKYAFSGCKNLISVAMGALTYGGDQIFRACENLKNVTLDEGLTRIYDSMFSECTSLESITIPNSVTMIQNSAFSGCTSLKSIDIPNNVTEIKSYAFVNCTSLTSVKISDNCTWIWERAFNGCTSLTSLTIPASVERIRDALQIGSSENKATITFLRTTPPEIYSNTFNADFIEKIIVRKGCGDVYKSATNFANFADYIEEMAE